MLSPEIVRELRDAWLPNMTGPGLDRLIDLLDKRSPLLVHGCFTKSLPMGCLATHVAWNHPATEHLTVEAAGVRGARRIENLARLARLHVLRRVQDGRVQLADDFFRLVAVQPAGALVPEEDLTVEVFANDGVFRGRFQNVADEVQRKFAPS